MSAPPAAVATQPAAAPCRTAAARIDFAFETAPLARCVIDGEREFSLVITPEHAPPINPSPWYAFHYRSTGEVVVHLRYLAGEHRYAPHWNDGTRERLLTAEVSEDGKEATLRLPAGDAIVSGQEVFASARYEALLARLSATPGAQRLVLGSSHDGRPIAAVRLGQADAPRLVVLLGRQHPPEVTGAIAMEAFLDALSGQLAREPALSARYQFIIVPLLNPDGVARGNWRANLGGKDLNRDWGPFTQPETRAVKAWLDGLPAGIRPVAMIDFHSTQRNLFYVQGEGEAGAGELRFLAAWLGGKEDALPGYPFTIERTNANPGSGTAKNWFHQAYGIPSYTYEVGDASDRAATRRAAVTLEQALFPALDTLSTAP